MKKTLLILILLRCITVSAHIRISDFKQSFSDGAAADVRTSAADPNGQLCAILKLETKPTGWTFDAGLAGIIDTRYGDGIIWIYLPASARKLTVANSEYGVLRDWSFPVSLEPGRTYTMKPSYERPPQTSQAQRPARMSAPTTLSGASQSTSRRVTPPLPTMVTNAAPRYAAAPSERTFCDHFVDFYMGFSCYKVYQDYYSFDDECWFGFSYIWIGNRVGLYASLAFNADECFSILGGLTLRLTDPKAATMDWHLYGGAGLIDDCLGFDVGARFAWRSSYKLSRWDFGLGCQFSQGAIIPTVSVGLYIWGIPAVIGLGLVCGGGYDMVNNNGSTVMPSELYDTLYQELLKQVIEKLETGLNVDSEECLDDCIFSSCYWLPEHILGCRDLDCNTTMDEIVDSIRKECPFADIVKTGLNSYKVKLNETCWTLYRIVQFGRTMDTKIRITYKHQSWRGFVPTNMSSEIIKYVDSLVPQFRKLVQKVVMEGNRQILLSLIEKTASTAKRRRRTKK